MFFKKLLGGAKLKRLTQNAQSLYNSCVKSARQPILFTDYGVEDSVDGRFDLISLHVFLIQNRLLDGDKDAKDLSQELSEVMWLDMDDCIREIGVGDLSVPKHMKRMIGAYQGRVRTYAASLEADDESLEQALWRNVYREKEGAQPSAEALAAYVRGLHATLGEADLSQLLTGQVVFPSAEKTTS